MLYNKYWQWFGPYVFAIVAVVIFLSATRLAMRELGNPAQASGNALSVSVRKREAQRRVVRSFIATAVQRKHVGRSYALVTKEFRQGITKKQWATGNIPVIPYFHIVRSRIAFKYHNSGEDFSQVLVTDWKQRSFPFVVGLKWEARAWRVSYWQAEGSPGVPSA